MKKNQNIKCSLLISAVVLVVNFTVAHAMTVNWSAASTTELTLSGGTIGLPMGDVVEIGTFPSLSDAQISALTNNIQTTVAGVTNAFSVWTTGNIGDGTGYEATFTETTVKPGNGFFNASIYLVAFHTNAVGTVTQIGVFKGNQTAISGVSDAWKFPASDLANPPSIETLGITASGVLIGAFDIKTYNSPWWGENVDALALQAIPEPSTMLLVGMGLLGVVGFRRRTR